MTCWYGGGGAKHYGLKNMDGEPVGPGRRWKWRWQGQWCFTKYYRIYKIIIANPKKRCIFAEKLNKNYKKYGKTK